MSNDKKCTVKEFYEKYNGTNVAQTKQAFVEKIMNPHYVPYEMKVTICEKIVENSYYKKIEKNGMTTRKLHVNSTGQYMGYCLWLVKQYTHIDINFENSLEEFNLLNKSEILDVIFSMIPEREVKEFKMILDMVESDTIRNEYETHAFISNQVDRFGELTGIVLKPLLEQLNEAIGNMDEKTIDKIVGKLKVLNGKFNIVK